MLRARRQTVLTALLVIASALSVFRSSPAEPAPQFTCRDVLAYFAGAMGTGVGDRSEQVNFFLELGFRVDTRKMTYERHVAGDGDGYDGHRYRPETDIADIARAWDRLHNFGDETGTYYRDVAEGVAEAAPYLNDRARACPDELWVLGGYSKGAHVIGDVLRGGHLSAAAKDNIAFVGLLSDPRLSLPGRDGRLTAPTCVGARPPWVRGEVPCWADGGVLATAERYVPADLEDKVGSWCASSWDAACSGNEAFVVGKTRYDLGGYGPGEAVQEAVGRLARRRPDLPAAAFDASRYGYEPLRDLDVAIVIDTTASMAGAFDRARAGARSVADAVLAQPGSRVALVQYKDVPDQGDSFTSRVEVPFTDDAAELRAGLDALSVGGGGADGPEAVYSGIAAALHELGWGGFYRDVVVIADAGGKDPEPTTNETAESLWEQVRSSGVDAILPLLTDAAARPFFEHLLESGQGRFLAFEGADPGAALIQAVEVRRTPPTAVLDGPRFARPGEAVTLDARRSSDVRGTIVEYRWDFDGDAVVDQTTTSPTTSHVYPGPYDGQAAVTVVSDDSGTDVAATSVTIADSPLAGVVLPMPQSVVATAADEDGTARVHWDPPPTDQPVWGWVVTPSQGSAAIGAGSVVVPRVTYIHYENVEVNPLTEAVVTGLPPGVSVTFTVWSVGDGGRGQPATSAPVVVSGEPAPPSTTTTTTSTTSSSSGSCPLDGAGCPAAEAGARSHGDPLGHPGRSPGGGTLPLTGAALLPLVAVALGLIGAGVAVLRTRARRR
jgi:hypothetical protein